MNGAAPLIPWALAAGLAAVGLTIPPDERPTTRVTDCATGGCHAEVTHFEFLHAPAAVDACEVCHAYQNPAEHTFRLIEQHEDEPICSFCHIGKSTFGRGGHWTGLHVHEPVEQGDCVSCHNPHGSDLRNLINADSVGALCSGCHDHIVDQPHMHPPVGDGECLSCHQPHSGQHARLLHEPGRELCLSCHTDVVPSPGVARAHPPRSPHDVTGADLPVGALFVIHTSALVALDSGSGTRDRATPPIVHEPLLGECSECHNPHGSPHPAMLQKDTRTLCTSCHEEVGRSAADADVHHSAVLDDRACLNCHLPHHSPHLALLSDQPIALCAGCHQDSHVRPDGRTVQGMSVLFSGSHLHGPINDGRCSDCHDVHGGEREALLTAHYSDALYLPFSEESYALCFSCHDLALATEKRTAGPGAVTGFRDGDLNLHYVHVTGPHESGRSCRFCHDTHASASPRQMRASVPYGEWNLPIRYEPTDTGGSCGAGCHRERSYTRDPRE